MKTRKKRGKTGQKWARYGLRSVNKEGRGGITWHHTHLSHHPSNNKPRSRLYIYQAGEKAGEVRTVESTTCLLGELDAKNASSFAFIDSVGEAFCNHRPALL